MAFVRDRVGDYIITRGSSCKVIWNLERIISRRLVLIYVCVDHTCASMSYSGAPIHSPRAHRSHKFRTVELYEIWIVVGLGENSGYKIVVLRTDNRMRIAAAAPTPRRCSTTWTDSNRIAKVCRGDDSSTRPVLNTLWRPANTTFMERSVRSISALSRDDSLYPVAATLRISTRVHPIREICRLHRATRSKHSTGRSVEMGAQEIHEIIYTPAKVGIRLPLTDISRNIRKYLAQLTPHARARFRRLSRSYPIPRPLRSIQSRIAMLLRPMGSCLSTARRSTVLPKLPTTINEARVR